MSAWAARLRETSNMGIQSFFDRKCDISRLGEVDEDGKRKFETALEDVPYHVQEIGEDRRRQLGILEENAWNGYYAHGTDIRQGDFVIDTGSGIRYEVKEVRLKNYAFAENKYVEVTLLQANA